MIERERTYLAKYIPEGLYGCPSQEIIDIYIPASVDHPTLRIRKNGEKYEITKKTPLHGTDSSEQLEQTIPLTPQEFKVLSLVHGKRIRKQRYYYKHQERTAEIDIFQEDLNGLVIVDFEFDNSEEKDNFTAPDFCLADVTQEKTFAGGVLCGKTYPNIEQRLKKFGYQKII